MAVTNYNTKCTCCGGNRWDYKKDRKVWICLYCDNQVERKEQYDGLYTIKNVARQVVLDSAYHRLEQADRNISECQKISATYVGTLIAGICFRLIAAVNGGYGNQDTKALLGQLKRDYQELNASYGTLGDDETALYEFMDSSDAWVALAMVFDTLGDEARRDYLLTLANPEEVFSKETNKSFLRFALKEDRGDLAEQILANTDNIQVKEAFSDVLECGKDGEQKARFGARLISAGALEPDDKGFFEDYLVGTDSAQTKAIMTISVLAAGIELNLGIVVREVFAEVELPLLQELLRALFSRRLYDGEVELLLNFSAMQKDADKCLAILDAMLGSGQFLSVNRTQCETFLFNTSFPAEGRIQILDRLKKFNTPDRLWESLVGNYLARAGEEAEVRNKLFPALLAGINSVPANDFEAYVLSCTADGAHKANRIQQVMELPGMNVGFFRELAGKYLKRGNDKPDIKAEVLPKLLECGFAVESAVLLEYICYSDDSDDNKIELLQLTIRNQGALRADALSYYLENCANRFSPQVFGAIYRDGVPVSAKALQNYVLVCRDHDTAKVQNAVTLARHMGVGLGASSCEVTHGSKMLKCNLAQAYVLLTTDEFSLVQNMVAEMERSGARLNADIFVNGISTKFRRYLNDNRGQLSETALKICEEKRLFSFSLFGF